jgi:phosphohistidine phosphatase
MKSLYLLRHAKSSWSVPGVSDQQRPLNERGLVDAPMMGARFRERGESLDHIVTSPALRARSTAELFAGACGFAPGAIEIDADLYFLGSGSVEAVILRQDDRLQSLMLVFHNPDITQFVNTIDYEIHVDNLPTCGLVKLSCDIAQWRDWSRSNSAFDYYDFPKNDSNAVLSLS